uniref:Uncharacterized protein n=1 Tax=Arion vulgaris TaxID=1028688 RepID=A0A0B6YAN6_9EUPU
MMNYDYQWMETPLLTPLGKALVMMSQELSSINIEPVSKDTGTANDRSRMLF